MSNSQHLLLAARALIMLCAIYDYTHGHTTEEHDAKLEHEQEGGNEIAISVGVIHEGSETNFSVGLEYERWFSDTFDAGLIIELS